MVDDIFDFFTFEHEIQWGDIVSDFQEGSPVDDELVTVEGQNGRPVYHADPREMRLWAHRLTSSLN